MLNEYDLWAVIAICSAATIVLTNYFDNKFRYKNDKNNEDEEEY